MIYRDLDLSSDQITRIQWQPEVKGDLDPASILEDQISLAGPQVDGARCGQTDPKFFHFDPAQARNNKMSKFMDQHHTAKCENKHNPG
jgi:hypothetical protein